MEHLGVEFYRNYIGIENPLRVTDMAGYDYTFETIYKNRLKMILVNGGSPATGGFSISKPHLKLPEDLTDEEWLWVFCGEDFQNNHGIRRGYSEAIIELIWDFGSYKSAVCKFDYSDNYFSQCNQEVLNRLYSLHSHPKAKEYIENGLAVKIEVK